jgi:hypothetical protein
MARFKIITLVDITQTNPHRSEADKKKLSQQANFNSLIQAIGLRANVSWINEPIRKNGKLPEPLDGKATYWVWEFDTERDFLFMKDQDPVGHLIADLHGVPIIDLLDNSVDITPAVFMTQGEKQNLWVSEISGI